MLINKQMRLLPIFEDKKKITPAQVNKATKKIKELVDVTMYRSPSGYYYFISNNDDHPYIPSIYAHSLVAYSVDGIIKHIKDAIGKDDDGTNSEDFVTQV